MKHKFLVLAAAGALAFCFVIPYLYNPTGSTPAKIFYCPMHPHIRADRPGQCPICHMQLVEFAEGASPAAAHEEHSKGAVSAVAGRAAVNLSSQRQELIGVATHRVHRTAIVHEIRARGRVAFDKELFAAIREFQLARRASEELSRASKGAARDADALVEAAQLKLRLLGISESRLKQLSKADTDSTELLLPRGSLSLYVEVFEHEIAHVHEGMSLIARSPALGDEEFHGTVISVSPILSSDTRTIRVIAELSDPQKQLRPDTFLSVTLQAHLGEKLVVPLDSVIRTGKEALVFVKTAESIFEPRSVELGISTRGFEEVRSGLNEGEEIVSAANFLIDSESRLQGVLKAGHDFKHH